MSIFRAVTTGMIALEGAEKTKGYHRQQREMRKRVTGPHPPGGAPPMRKVSAKQALNFYLRKQAGAPKVPLEIGAKHMGKALLYGAGITAGTMGVIGAGKGVAGAYQRLASERMFSELKRRYPDIKRQEKKAREAFDLAIAYAPSLLKHPVAIGDFVRRQLEFPMSSHEYLKQLADLEATVSKSEVHSAPAQFGAQTGDVARGLLVPLSTGV